MGLKKVGLEGGNALNSELFLETPKLAIVERKDEIMGHKRSLFTLMLRTPK